MKPHKHCEIIKAWADGAEIESSIEGVIWTKAILPTWREDLYYRVKKRTCKYRLYLWESEDGAVSVEIFNVAFHDPRVQDHPSFIRWVGETQEVEV